MSEIGLVETVAPKERPVTDMNLAMVKMMALWMIPVFAPIFMFEYFLFAVKMSLELSIALTTTMATISLTLAYMYKTRLAEYLQGRLMLGLTFREASGDYWSDWVLVKKIKQFGRTGGLKPFIKTYEPRPVKTPKIKTMPYVKTALPSLIALFISIQVLTNLGQNWVYYSFLMGLFALGMVGVNNKISNTGVIKGGYTYQQLGEDYGKQEILGDKDWYKYEIEFEDFPLLDGIILVSKAPLLGRLLIPTPQQVFYKQLPVNASAALLDCAKVREFMPEGQRMPVVMPLGCDFNAEWQQICSGGYGITPDEINEIIAPGGEWDGYKYQELKMHEITTTAQLKTIMESKKDFKGRTLEAAAAIQTDLFELDKGIPVTERIGKKTKYMILGIIIVGIAALSIGLWLGYVTPPP